MICFLSSVLLKKNVVTGLSIGGIQPPVSISGGGYEYLPCRRHKWQSIKSLENLNGGGQNENLSCRRASSKEWLAGPGPCRGGEQHIILESYYYARNNQWIESIIPKLDDFMLDSGAFTAMQGNAMGINWEEYVSGYADFITRNKIEKFFELDIDSIVGLEVVEKLRKKLERLTGKQPIPVWHKNRGLDYFKGISRDYPYVAIGGIVSREIPREKYERAFPFFLETAHNASAKIHALGYTHINNLHNYHFDSVDSTAWLYGNRGGYLYRFNETAGIMEQIDKPGGTRLKSTEAAIHNYREWQKFQLYAKKFL